MLTNRKERDPRGKQGEKTKLANSSASFENSWIDRTITSMWSAVRADVPEAHNIDGL